MVITYENRGFINGNELDIHDACFYSIETKFIDGKYRYTFKANSEWTSEKEILFVFSGVTSCIFTGENHTNLLGKSINSWYSLPSYPYGTLADTLLTKEEMEELNQHGIYKITIFEKTFVFGSNPTIFAWKKQKSFSKWCSFFLHQRS